MDYIVFSRCNKTRVTTVENSPSAEKVAKLKDEGWHIVSVGEMLDSLAKVEQLRSTLGWISADCDSNGDEWDAEHDEEQTK